MNTTKVAVQSALFTKDILQEVDQATCRHPDSIIDGTASICTSCGKNLNMVSYEKRMESIKKINSFWAGMQRDFGKPIWGNTHGNGVTDYDSFKSSEMEALIDRRAE